MKVPTSSKLLCIIVGQLEATTGPPTFTLLQEAIKHATSKMPAVKNAGISAETHEVQMLISQTVDIGFVFVYQGRIMLTEAGRNYLNGVSNNG